MEGFYSTRKKANRNRMLSSLTPQKHTQRHTTTQCTVVSYRVLIRSSTSFHSTCHMGDILHRDSQNFNAPSPKPPPISSRFRDIRDLIFFLYEIDGKRGSRGSPNARIYSLWSIYGGSPIYCEVVCLTVSELRQAKHARNGRFGAFFSHLIISC